MAAEDGGEKAAVNVAGLSRNDGIIEVMKNVGGCRRAINVVYEMAYGYANGGRMAWRSGGAAAASGESWKSRRLKSLEAANGWRRPAKKAG